VVITFHRSRCCICQCESKCNVYIGRGSGSNTCQANENVLIGHCSGRNICKGDRNVIIGGCAGYSITDGCCNIVIGQGVELPSATSNNTLSIGAGTDRWITGDSSYNIKPGRGITDCDGNTGTNGQVLSSTGGAYVKWVAASGGGGGSGVSQAKATAISMIFG